MSKSRRNEVSIQAALRDLDSGKCKSVREAANAHKVARSTLQGRINGQQSHLSSHTGDQILTTNEEQRLVNWTLDLNSQGKPPSIPNMREMATSILRQNGENHVIGNNWVQRFRQRHPEISTRKRKKIDSKGESPTPPTDLMEQPSAVDYVRRLTQLDTAAELEHPTDRRREKPQLSCNFCRRRKIRCDRQHPCKNCIEKGIGLSCTYAAGPQRKEKPGVGERIQQLEAMVRSLAQQQHNPQTPAVTPIPSTGEGAGQTTVSHPKLASLSGSKNFDRSSASLEHGSMRMHSHGANYVGSVHWAAVLDSISELKDYYQEEEEARVLTTNDYLLRDYPGPRMFYEPVNATKADILASIPARPVVDRMVGRHFNAQGLTPPVLHSGQFLREYESFWKNPDTTSFTYIGLLFSIMCLSVQSNQLSEDPADPEALMRVYLFRERTVQCLVLGQFTRGGAYVLETIINYCTSEVLLCKDADIGLWLLLGMLVQLALSQGYHRDPRNFPKISPFDGEMRRRVWVVVRQIDLRLSSQMGLPRLLQSQQYDTADPRNLLDSDFDETTVEIPPSRSDTEVTPVLYGLAKNRIDGVGGLIGDLIADTREHPYAEIMELDQKLQDAETSLPSIFRWQPLSQSFMVPPLIVLHRVWLQIAVQRLTICLHRKYLAPPYTELRYKYSRNSCVQAAIKMLEYQRLIDEETQPDGQLHSVRWVSSSLLQTTFLLGMSVLCYYVQLAKTTPDLSLGQETDTKIYGLLRDTYPMWLRSSIVSRDARDAVERLRRLLGLPNQQDSGKSTQEGLSHFDASHEAGLSLDQVTWDAYQECIANFTVAFDADFLTLEAGGSSSGVFS